MNRANRFLSAVALGLFFVGAATADTLELKDGRILKGKYLGGTQAVLRFELSGEVQTFSTTEIVALTFTGNPGHSAPTPAPAAAPPETPAMAPTAGVASSLSGGNVTIPAGQSLLVRMIDTVDSSKNHVGDIFHASLETDLNVNGILVARKGSDVYGRLASADQGGKFSGKSELQLELTRLMIDGRDYSLVSSDYNLQGKSRGSDSAKKVGGGAIVGAISGGI